MKGPENKLYIFCENQGPQIQHEPSQLESCHQLWPVMDNNDMSWKLNCVCKNWHLNHWFWQLAVCLDGAHNSSDITIKISWIFEMSLLEGQSVDWIYANGLCLWISDFLWMKLWTKHQKKYQISVKRLDVDWKVWAAQPLQSHSQMKPELQKMSKCWSVFWCAFANENKSTWQKMFWWTSASWWAWIALNSGM